MTNKGKLTEAPKYDKFITAKGDRGMGEFNKDKYDQQYKKDHFDIISFFAPKGTKDKIKEMAKEQGVSNSEFMRQLVTNAINTKTPAK